MVGPVLAYEILGPLRVRSEEGEVAIPGARRRALLVRLLTSANREVPADRLADDLWQGDPPPGAASTLQSHVSFLRRTLGPASLEHRSGAYLLNIDEDGFDVRQFESENREGQRAFERGEFDDAEDHLSRALSRWRGDPLIDANEAAWALPEIGRLQELRLTAGESWHDVLLALGRQEQVIASAEVILSEHRWRERLWGQLMLALYRTGRQAEALRTFQRLREELGSELGIEPSRELVDLEEAILLQKPELDWVAPAQHRSPTPKGSVLDPLVPVVPLPERLREGPAVYVGREEARAELAQALKGADSDGQPRVALVSGEPGIGKTSLASVVAQDGHRSGATVLYGRCDRDLGLPYQPWREAVGHLVDHVGPLQEAVAEKATLLRTFGLSSPIESSPASTDGTDLYLLFNAILEVMAAAAHPDGLILVLDDIHWADAQSLQVLRRLAARSVPMAALVIATYRDSEVASGTPLATLLADLHRETGVTRLALHGLGDLELLALIETATGHQLDEMVVALRDAILAETDGNPFFVGELFRHLIEIGTISTDGHGHWLANSDVSSWSLPSSLLEVIGERVTHLGPLAAHALSVASVIGRDFDLDVLCGALGSDTSSVLDHLESASRASLVSDLGGGRFTFTHALIERALYDQLNPTRRAYTHLQVAEAIERLSTSEGERVPELARHWLLATAPQDTNKALSYAKQAADQALANLAPHDARDWYRQAHALLDQGQSTDERLRCELLIGLGDAQRQCGDPVHRHTLLSAAAAAVALGDSGLLVRAALANTRGFFAEAGQIDADRVAILETGVERTEEITGVARARLLSLLAAELAFDGDYERRRRLADEALDVARTTEDPSTLLAVLNLRIAAIQAPDTLSEVLASTDEALSLAEQTNNPILEAFAAGWRYFATWQAGDRPEADRMWAIMDESSIRLGQPTLRWLTRFLEAHRAFISGTLTDSERLAEEALDIGTETGQPDAFNIYGAQVLRIGRERDQAESFIPIVEQALEANPNDHPATLMLCRLYCDTHRADEARQLVAPYLENVLRVMTGDLFWATSLAIVADTVADLRWLEPTTSLLSLLEPYVDQWDWVSPASQGPLSRPVARLLSLAGDHARADEVFARALRSSSSASAPVYEAHTHFDWGRAQHARSSTDDRSNGRDHLLEARRLAQKCGLKLLERLSNELLARNA